MNKSFLYIFICCAVILFSCQKEYSFEKGNILPAAGSLWDSTGNCLPDSVHGTFYNGITPGQDTAYVEVQVNVTQTGSYSITSDQQDGFEFYDSGFFSNTGINTIRLKPIGIPIIPTTSTFHISFDSTFCSFDVTIQDSTGTGLGGHDSTGTNLGSGNWQFTTGDGTFSGTFYAATIFKDTAIWNSGGQMLGLAGYTKSSTDSAISLLFYLPSGTIVPGTYTTQAAPPENAAVFAFNYTTSGDPIYEAIPGGNDSTNVTLTISSYDNTTHIITGTFSGKSEDANGNAAVDVTNGSFTATVEP